ncbi:MAG: hypothetical protein JJ926_03870 [Roseitalea sp.]|nr:hypothetical protein [Roseitalea sp.]MBO6950994.1 hypothetical protein [Rhizobiaceae bacterium]MBO6591019.1 hypothetical protein [Roseitalea sp.]MBO6599723.1 hypothetical protein [Roseitalea sp.]MBO6611479.1 hypothetical protein [Roseitalea sp.]
MTKFGRSITQEEWEETRQAALDNMGDIKRLLKAANDNDILLGFQRRLLASTARHAVTVCVKSRRTGATWAIAADAILHAGTSKSAGGMDVFYVGYNLEMAREFIDVCGTWARAFDHAATEIDEFVFEPHKDPDKEIKAFRIRFASGFQIVALPSRPRSLRGKQGYIIIDEAAFHDDLDKVMKAALALLIWGGKVCVISTHDTDANPFNTLVEEIRSKKKPYNLVEFDFDDALRDGLYKRIAALNGDEYSIAHEATWRAEILEFYGDDADEELFCIPSAGTGIYLTRELIRRQMRDDVPVLRWTPPAKDFTEWPKAKRQSYMADWIAEHVDPLLKALDPDLRHAFGQDYAYSIDLSVLWPVAIGRDLKRRTPFIIEMRRMPFEQQKQLLFHVAGRLPRLTGGKIDANGSGHALAQVTMQRFGARLIEEVHISREWYREHMPIMRTAMEDDDFLIPKDDDVEVDFRMVRLREGVPQVPRQRKTSLADGKKRHGDTAVAACLAYAASDMPPLEYDGYQAAHAKDDDDDDDDDFDDHVEGDFGYERNDGLI